MIKINLRVVFAASAGLMAVAAACGGDDNSASRSDPTPVTAGPAAPTSTAEGAVFSWQVETVDEGTKPALALTSDGTPYVAYMLEAITGFVKAALLARLIYPFIRLTIKIIEFFN